MSVQPPAVRRTFQAELPPAKTYEYDRYRGEKARISHFNIFFFGSECMGLTMDKLMCFKM